MFGEAGCVERLQSLVFPFVCDYYYIYNGVDIFEFASIYEAPASPEFPHYRL